ncbi:ATP-binding protein [Sneathiella glossodoripedis]|uniref:ATP-binding protein n=1 Tax=Sneathiella glossodoripedis TaxID=418853 RepID=UPI000472732B|nr:ATP-binding protein [Sneathiella glossodoripedis]
MLSEKDSNIILMSTPHSVLHEVFSIGHQDYNMNFVDLLDSTHNTPAIINNALIAIADFDGCNKDQQELLLNFFQSQSVRTTEVILFFNKSKSEDLLPEIIEQATTLVSPVSEKEQILELLENTLAHLKNARDLKNNLNSTLKSFGLLTKGKFELSTLSEARSLSVLLSSLFPENKNLTLGLTELLINGIEHGNLGISFDEKGKLLSSGKWQEEVERRQKLKENSKKVVTLTYERGSDFAEFLITDEGEGFDTSKFMNSDGPNLALGDLTNFHGRGIKLAKQLCFDKLEYLGCGNQVRGIINI